MGMTTNTNANSSSMPTGYGPVPAAVRAARRSSDHVVLEGVHAVKHALRFGAELQLVATDDTPRLDQLLATLAPDVHIATDLRHVLGSDEFMACTGGRAMPSPVVAVARRPRVTPDDVIRAPGRTVVLERPRHLGNLGATIRVAAAAGVGGVLVIGSADPWHPDCIRGAAGLQFALPVARTERLPASGRPLVALDPTGEPLGTRPLPDDAVLLFGTERDGLSEQLLARADDRVAIPMRPGVSSLNLATAVAVAVYTN